MKEKTKKIVYVSYGIAGIAVFAFFFHVQNSIHAANNVKQIDEEITNIKGGIESQQSKIDDLKNQINAYEKKIKSHQNQASTLNNQIQQLDAQAEKTKLAIALKNLEVEGATQKISVILNGINQLDRTIEEKKNTMSALMYDLYITGKASSLEIFVLNDTLSDYFQDVDSLENISAAIEDNIESIKQNKAHAEEKKITLEEEKTIFEQIKVDLEQQNNALRGQKTAKNILLDETKKNEAKYQTLLKQTRAEQASIDAEIVRLDKQLRQKLLEKSKLQNNLDSFSGEKFAWPVPENIITAYFHDPSYPFRTIFEHPAIDIRAAQGTAVKAAASGYVGKVQRDKNCTGSYAYVMIIHANNLSTVYGHLSRIDVEEEQFVVQGQQIGRSGASPHTCGSGRLTTGPHMHLEIRKDGIPQNPLNYLP